MRKTISKVVIEFEEFVNQKINSWLKDKTAFVDSKSKHDITFTNIDTSKYHKSGLPSAYTISGQYRNIITSVDPYVSLPKKIASSFKQTNIYQKTIKHKGFRNKICKIQFENFLHHYGVHLLNREFEVNPDLKKSIINILLDSIKIEKFKFKNTLYCHGIIVPEGTINIKYQEFDIAIRKPSDLEFAQFNKKYRNLKLNNIIEIECYNEKYDFNITIGRELLKTALCLYSLCSFSINYTNYKQYFSNSVYNSITKNIYKENDIFKTKILKSEKIKIQNFLKYFSTPILAVKNEKNEKDSFVYSLKLATDQFLDCLLNPKIDWKKRITQSIMGLEAIWLTDDDKETIGFKLKIRCSKILIRLGLNIQEVPQNISIGYSIRSSYAHGSSIKKELRKKIINGTIDVDKLQKEVLNYLRISIVAGMLLINNNKKEYISDLTKSIYDEGKNKEVNKDLKSMQIILNKCLPLIN